MSANYDGSSVLDFEDTIEDPINGSAIESVAKKPASAPCYFTFAGEDVPYGVISLCARSLSMLNLPMSPTAFMKSNETFGTRILRFMLAQSRC